MEENMNVIRHYHEGLEEVTVSVEMPERVGDDLGDGGILKDAIAGSRI